MKVKILYYLVIMFIYRINCVMIDGNDRTCCNFEQSNTIFNYFLLRPFKHYFDYIRKLTNFSSVNNIVEYNLNIVNRTLFLLVFLFLVIYVRIIARKEFYYFFFDKCIQFVSNVIFIFRKTIKITKFADTKLIFKNSILTAKQPYQIVKYYNQDYNAYSQIQPSRGLSLILYTFCISILY